MEFTRSRQWYTADSGQSVVKRGTACVLPQTQLTFLLESEMCVCVCARVRACAAGSGGRFKSNSGPEKIPMFMSLCPLTSPSRCDSERYTHTELERKSFQLSGYTLAQECARHATTATCTREA